MTICDRCNAKGTKTCDKCHFKAKEIKKQIVPVAETTLAIVKVKKPEYQPVIAESEAILAEFGTKKEPIKLIERESGLYLRDNHGECKITVAEETGSIDKIIAHISAKAKRIYSYEPVRGLNWKWAEYCRVESLGCTKAGLA